MTQRSHLFLFLMAECPVLPVSVGPVLRSCQQQRFGVIGRQSGPVLAHPNCWNRCLMSSPNLPFHNYSPSLCSCPLWHGEEIIPLFLLTAVFCVLKVVILSYLFCCVMNRAPYVVPHPLRLTLLLLMSSVHLPGGIWCLRARRVLCTQPHQRGARCRARFVHLPVRFLFLQLHPMAADFCLWWMAIWAQHWGSFLCITS